MVLSAGMLVNCLWLCLWMAGVCLLKILELQFPSRNAGRVGDYASLHGGGVESVFGSVVQRNAHLSHSPNTTLPNILTATKQLQQHHLHLEKARQGHKDIYTERGRLTDRDNKREKERKRDIETDRH